MTGFYLTDKNRSTRVADAPSEVTVEWTSGLDFCQRANAHVANAHGAGIPVKLAHKLGKQDIRLQYNTFRLGIPKCVVGFGVVGGTPEARQRFIKEAASDDLIVVDLGNEVKPEYDVKVAAEPAEPTPSRVNRTRTKKAGSK